MIGAEVSKVKDELVSDFCSNLCPEDQVEDYHCPNHSCPVWRALTLLTEIEVLTAPRFP